MQQINEEGGMAAHETSRSGEVLEALPAVLGACQINVREVVL